MVGHDFPVADDQMDGDGHRYDDLQGDKVGGDHGDFPIERSQQSGRSKNRRTTGQQRQQNPTKLAEYEPECENEENRHANSEYKEVISDKSNQIIGDHRHPAQK